MPFAPTAPSISKALFTMCLVHYSNIGGEYQISSRVYWLLLKEPFTNSSLYPPKYKTKIAVLCPNPECICLFSSIGGDSVQVAFLSIPLALKDILVVLIS
ncbi:hypothetical protein CDAR_207081 [Caerostris darwini]|uniref:Uncharacterized protein n=1 Tax=Caerostris darwini TaxID=1538125 RepID=A0AAV4SPH8_9ARAC|nr:hypothetical protein CDAR_207081 [Caerostris darwini]